MSSLLSLLQVRVVVGEWAIVAEGAIVTMWQEIPARKIAAGNPAKVIGDITDEHQQMWGWGKKIYVDLCHRYRDGLKKL